MRVVYVSAILAIICVLVLSSHCIPFATTRKKGSGRIEKKKQNICIYIWKNYVKLNTHEKKKKTRENHMPNENLIGETDRSNSTHIQYSKSTWIYFAKGIKHETFRFFLRNFAWQFFFFFFVSFSFQRCEDLRCGVWSVRWLSPLQPKHKYEKKEHLRAHNGKKEKKKQQNSAKQRQQDWFIFLVSLYVMPALTIFFYQVTINYIIPRQTHAHASIANAIRKKNQHSIEPTKKKRQPQQQQCKKKMKCIQGFLVTMLTILHFVETHYICSYRCQFLSFFRCCP